MATVVGLAVEYKRIPHSHIHRQLPAPCLSRQSIRRKMPRIRRVSCAESASRRNNNLKSRRLAGCIARGR